MATVQITRDVSRTEIEQLKARVREVVTDNAAVLMTQAYLWDPKYMETVPYWVSIAKLDLQDAGFRVIMPRMPNRIAPKAPEWVSETGDAMSREYGTPGRELFMVGTSLGGRNNYLYMDTLPAGVTLGGVITIATPYTNRWPVLDSFFEQQIDWKKIKGRSSNFALIHSITDPKVPFSDVYEYARHLRVAPTLEENMGHYGLDDRHVIENKQLIAAILRQYLANVSDC